jgi:hypothetical protein
LHELAGDVVDDGDVIGFDGMTQPESIRKERRAQHYGVITEGDEGPDPGQQICAEQDRIDPGDLAARIASAVAEDLMKKTLKTFAELQRRVDSRWSCARSSR